MGGTTSVIFNAPFVRQHDLISAAREYVPRLIDSPHVGVGGTGRRLLGRVPFVELGPFRIDSPVAGFVQAEAGSLSQDTVWLPRSNLFHRAAQRGGVLFVVPPSGGQLKWCVFFNLDDLNCPPKGGTTNRTPSSLRGSVNDAGGDSNTILKIPSCSTLVCSIRHTHLVKTAHLCSQSEVLTGLSNIDQIRVQY